MNTVLYPRQKQILSFVNNYIEEFGSAPSLTEIKNHIGVKTLSTVHEHLAKLEAKGLIEKVKDTKGLYFSMKWGQHQGSLIQVPFVGFIAAGKPILAVEQANEYISLPAEIIGKRSNLYCLRVKGDSMIDALINNNDIVVIEKSDTADNGDTVVALLEDNTATLKKIYKERNRIRLKPANPHYDDIIVKKVTVQGKVVAVFRKY